MPKDDKMKDGYYDKPVSVDTLSGFTVKELYTPDDMSDIDYDKELGDSGEYPYTRGVHRNMFRGRYWTMRAICGYGTTKDTNERLKFQMSEGASGLWLIPDLPTHYYIDADHPFAEGEVGRVGVPVFSLKDMEQVMDGIPADKVSMTIGAQSPVVLAQYFACAEKQGVPLTKIRGTLQNDPIHGNICLAFVREFPLDLAVKLTIDIVEYCAKHVPLWNTICVGFYNWRERGISAVQELAFGMSSAEFYIQEALKRGLNVDEIAPQLSAYPAANMDFLEEIAKLRATRRMWARMMKEKFGAKNPRSLKFRFGVRTSGSALVPQQPLNNIIRVTCQAMAAVLGGCQSLECCCYDEPVSIPTEESTRISLRTQQIIANETGVVNVSDPLGGSYFIENLTNKIEEEANKIIKQIDDQGGPLAAAKNGWFFKEIDKVALERQIDIESGKRRVVGVNCFTINKEDETPVKIQKVSMEPEKIMVENLKKLKESRDNKKVRDALNHLREEAEKGEMVNLMPPLIEAVKAYATTGEVMGTIREAYGYSYDPFQKIKSPTMMGGNL